MLFTTELQFVMISLPPLPSLGKIKVIATAMKKNNLVIKSEEQWFREAGFMHIELKKLLNKFDDPERVPTSFALAELKEYQKRFPDGTEMHPGGALVLLEVLKVYARLIARYVKNGSEEEIKTTTALAVDEINSYYNDALNIMRQSLNDFESNNKK